MLRPRAVELRQSSHGLRNLHRGLAVSTQSFVAVKSYSLDAASGVHIHHADWDGLCSCLILRSWTSSYDVDLHGPLRQMSTQKVMLFQSNNVRNTEYTYIDTGSVILFTPTSHGCRRATKFLLSCLLGLHIMRFVSSIAGHDQRLHVNRRQNVTEAYINWGMCVCCSQSERLSDADGNEMAVEQELT